MSRAARGANDARLPDGKVPEGQIVLRESNPQTRQGYDALGGGNLCLLAANEEFGTEIGVTHVMPPDASLALQ